MSEEWVSRALAAWYRGSKTGHTRMYPAEGMSAHVALPDGKQYVVIANSFQVLGVYRIRPSGVLRLLKKWPKAVEEELPYDR
jgi:hypothetical protein